MPRRSGRSSRSEPRWAEPPSGLFPGGEDLLRLLAVLAIATAVAAACSFLNRRPSPFCDSDADPYAYDSCEPCPENGRCADGELECVQGFRRRGNRCVEDGVLTRTANKIAESLQRRICDEHARALCGQPGKILYNQLDISNMADELLSNDPARLTDDGMRVVKDRVLQSAHGFLETTLTDDKYELRAVQTEKLRRMETENGKPKGDLLQTYFVWCVVVCRNRFLYVFVMKS